MKYSKAHDNRRIKFFEWLKKELSDNSISFNIKSFGVGYDNWTNLALIAKTKVGDWTIKIFDDWIATKFDDPKKAISVISNINQFSGKHNFHIGRVKPNDIFKYLKYSISCTIKELKPDTKLLKTQCPVFTDFDNDTWEMNIDSFITGENQKRGIEGEPYELSEYNFTFDNKKYHKDLAYKIVIEVEDYIKEALPSVEYVIFKDNDIDTINIELECKCSISNDIKTYLNENYDEWNAFIKNNNIHSTYSADDFKDKPANYTILNSDDLYAILSFICRDIDEDDIESNVLQDIYVSDYASLNCLICYESGNVNHDGICSDCEDDQEYQEFVMKRSDWKAVQKSPLLPGIDLKSVEPTFDYTEKYDY
jgi:hypothetical protein